MKTIWTYSNLPSKYYFHKYKLGIKKNAFHLGIACISLFGLSACDDNSGSSESSDLQANMIISNRMSTTGNIHLDLRNSVYDSIDNISYSIKVADEENDEIIFEAVDVPVKESQTLQVDFSPLGQSVPLWRSHNFKRTLAIDYTLHHANNVSDSIRDYINIDETLAVGDVSQSVTDVQARIESDVSGPVNDSDACKATCTLSDEIYPLCVMPATQNCYSVNLNRLMVLAAELPVDIPDFKITEDTPIWLQAAGGFGGDHSNGTDQDLYKGGLGGFSQTVTTIAHLIATPLVDGSIYYYIGNAGLQNLYAKSTGGASTIVTKYEINAPINDINDIVLIAGGGGGGGGKNTTNIKGRGGHGGVAITDATAEPKVYKTGEGDTGGEGLHGGNGGGKPVTDSSGKIINAKGGEGRHHGASGSDGFGGDGGNHIGWVNKDITDVLAGAGKGGSGIHSNGAIYPGGGGGFGGGAAATKRNNGDVMGAGGGGSYAMPETVIDRFAPTDISEIENVRPKAEVHRDGKGWFRIVFSVYADD